MSNVIPSREKLKLEEILEGVSYYMSKEYTDTNGNLENYILFGEMCHYFTDGLFLALKENNIPCEIIFVSDEDERNVFSCVKSEGFYINCEGDVFKDINDMSGGYNYESEIEKDNMESFTKTIFKPGFDSLEYKKDIIKYSLINKELKLKENKLKRAKEKLKTTDWGMSF